MAKLSRSFRLGLTTQTLPINALALALALVLSVSSAAQDEPSARVISNNDDIPLRIDGPEQSQLVLSRPDGGLPPVAGVQSFQVFRATKSRPDLSDGLGWTYHHHVDMTCWKGRLYVGWDSCERDEDTWPSRELYSTSLNGTDWAPPAELFPQGISTPLRMYFFHAPNGRMLVIAGLRMSQDKTGERTKGPLVVREILSDHSLGPVFTLRPPKADRADQPPLFAEAKDAGFVKACEQLLANRVFLEQQDYGSLLEPAQRMQWNDPANWPGDADLKKDAEDFGKAMAFFHRSGGELVGVGKKGWVTVSHDDGSSWSQPVRPATLVTNMGKVWGQRTSDGHYALVYNPDKKQRYPLVIVTSDDGKVFRDMRVVYGELPARRYEGGAKSPGPSYVRGISEWSGDGSWQDPALWLVYSVNKEDIWVSRVPVPVKSRTDGIVADNFKDNSPGAIIPGWNTYGPKWARVELVSCSSEKTNCLQLEDRDPYDHARADRLFPAARKVKVTFQVKGQSPNPGSLEAILLGEPDAHVAVRCNIAAVDRWQSITVQADCESKKYSVTIDGKSTLAAGAFEESTDTVGRISFQTVNPPEVQSQSAVVLDADHPIEPATYQIRELKIEQL